MDAAGKREVSRVLLNKHDTHIKFYVTRGTTMHIGTFISVGAIHESPGGTGSVSRIRPDVFARCTSPRAGRS